MMLAVAALATPIAGVNPVDDLTVHRVNMDGLPMAEWDTADHVTAVCGAHVRLLSLDDRGDEPVRWKWLRTRGTRYRRCPVCNGRAS